MVLIYWLEKYMYYKEKLAKAGLEVSVEKYMVMSCE
jgi:hypothetical protein